MDFYRIGEHATSDYPDKAVEWLDLAKRGKQKTDDMPDMDALMAKIKYKVN